MRSLKSAILYGLAVWVIPFVVAMIAFPLRENDRAFFESIMPVAVTLAVVLFTVKYFHRVEKDFVKEGIWLGIVFLVVSVVIDLLLFSKGPMAMPLISYIKDIGFTYLAMPVVTVGVGCLLHRRLHS